MTIVPRLTLFFTIIFCLTSAAHLVRGETARAPVGSSLGERKLFGLIIGNNTSNGKEAALRYADDDAVQNADLLLQLGANVVLLTEMDQETRSLYPDLNPVAPTRYAVDAAVRRLNKLMQEARDRGETPTFYFFFSGHGDVEGNEGYVHLEGSRLMRTDLIGFLKESKAISNHVVIDACKSFFMVFDRGPGGTRQPVRGILEENESALPTNTGVMLSTSSSGDSHEWEAFQGGVFSHELRSALRGAADVDLDGVVSYTEAAAFIWIANAAIPNQRYRPAFYSRAPSDETVAAEGLVHVARGEGDTLHLGPKVSQHFYVEDAQGLRLADFHPEAEQTLAILLPKRRPLFLRESGSDLEFILPQGSQLYFDQLQAKKRSVSPRGAEHLAFQRIFALRFGKNGLLQYIHRPLSLNVSKSREWKLKWTRRSFGISAAVLGVAGGVFTGVALRERNSVSGKTSGEERAELNTRIRHFNTASIVCYSVAGAALATYLIWTLWPDRKREASRASYYADGLNLGVKF